MKTSIRSLAAFIAGTLGMGKGKAQTQNLILTRFTPAATFFGASTITGNATQGAYKVKSQRQKRQERRRAFASGDRYAFKRP